MSEALFWRSDGVSLRSDFLSKKPHFFRIMHPALLKDGKPEIPKRFLRKYGKHLSSIVFLKVPSGAQWPVELMKCHGEVWLQGGWQEFCEFYSIGYGHFLLFRYEGDSHFHVLIFDMTASEIEYPSADATHDEEPNNIINNGVCQPSILKENHENDVSLEILDDFPASQTTKEEDIINITSSDEEEFNTNEPCSLPKIKENERDVSVSSQNTRMKKKLPCLQPSERRRNSPPHKPFNIYNFQVLFPHLQSKGIQGTGKKSENLETELDLHSPTPEFRDEVNFDAREGDGVKATSEGRIISQVVPPVAASKKVGALLRAESFKPQNPFFIIIMRPSYVTTGRNMNIPLRFVKRHFTTYDKNTTLWVPDGRTWTVKFCLRRHDAKLSSGWGKFAHDNYLQVGDVCVFELIKSTANLIRVVIFRK